MPRLENNPMLIRQSDERVLGPFQVLDEDGAPLNLSQSFATVQLHCYDRPGGTKIFAVGGSGGTASGGKILVSTGKESGHIYFSISSEAFSTNTPGPYPTEVFASSINGVAGRRTHEGPMFLLQERLA